MNIGKEKMMMNIKNLVNAALPEMLNLLPTLFPNGITLTLSTLGNIALNYKASDEMENDNNMGIRYQIDKLENRIHELSPENQNSTLEEIRKVCLAEMQHLMDEKDIEVYTVDSFEIVMRNNVDVQDVYEVVESYFNDSGISEYDYMYARGGQNIIIVLQSPLYKNQVLEIMEECDSYIIEQCETLWGRSLIKKIYLY